MAFSKEAKERAATNPGLRLVDQVPDRDGAPPSGWDIYQVRDAATVAPLRYEPVVVDAQSGTQSECFGRRPIKGQKDPELGPWECMAAGWWNTPAALDRPLAAGGPASWARVTPARANSAPRRRLPAVKVSDVHETDDSVSFQVSRTGVPIVVRTSYFPNWEASGANGPWRLTPNLMVVVPTSRTVTLNYARSGPEWIGIFLTVVGVAGLVGLVIWRPRRPDSEPDPSPDPDPPAGQDPPVPPEIEPNPSQPREPDEVPALP
jgi:hypothetical protein